MQEYVEYIRFKAKVVQRERYLNELHISEHMKKHPSKLLTVQLV